MHYSCQLDLSAVARNVKNTALQSSRVSMRSGRSARVKDSLNEKYSPGVTDSLEPVPASRPNPSKASAEQKSSPAWEPTPQMPSHLVVKLPADSNPTAGTAGPSEEKHEKYSPEVLQYLKERFSELDSKIHDLTAQNEMLAKQNIAQHMAQQKQRDGDQAAHSESTNTDSGGAMAFHSANKQKFQMYMKKPKPGLFREIFKNAMDERGGALGDEDTNHTAEATEAYRNFVGWLQYEEMVSLAIVFFPTPKPFRL